MIKVQRVETTAWKPLNIEKVLRKYIKENPDKKQEILNGVWKAESHTKGK